MKASRDTTILIVEDDAEARRLFTLVLRFEGFDVHEVSDGLAALRYLDDRKPDLVLLDLNLPQINGDVVRWEIAAHAHLSAIPIVIITGSAENLDHLQVPCVLRKPVTADDLVRAVRRCLASGAPPVSS